MQVAGLNKIRNLESFVYTAVMVDLEELCCFSHAVVCAVFFCSQTGTGGYVVCDPFRDIYL